MTEKMPESAACSHSRVALVTVHYKDGTCSDSWRCTDCGTNFWPALALLSQERDTLKAENVELQETVKAQSESVILGWLKVERDKRREFEKGLVAWRKACHKHQDEQEALEAENTRLREELAKVEESKAELVSQYEAAGYFPRAARVNTEKGKQ